MVASGKPDAQIIVTAQNRGDANIDGDAAPVAITDKLPAGLEAVAIEGIAGSATGNNLNVVLHLLAGIAQLQVRSVCTKTVWERHTDVSGLTNRSKC